MIGTKGSGTVNWAASDTTQWSFPAIYGVSFNQTVLRQWNAGGQNNLAAGAILRQQAIASIERGQWEACASIGMTRAQAMRRAILPQAMRTALPQHRQIALALAHRMQQGDKDRQCRRQQHRPERLALVRRARPGRAVVEGHGPVTGLVDRGDQCARGCANGLDAGALQSGAAGRCGPAAACALL